MKIFNVLYFPIVYIFLQTSSANQYPLSFLSLDQHISKESSSEDALPALSSSGAISAGIEELDYSLSSLSSHIDDSLQALDSKLTSSITLDYEAAIVILNSSIQDKLNIIDDIDLNIQILTSSLSDYSNQCDRFSTCKGCSMNSNCVWCKTEHRCISGDSDGPFHAECSEFSYKNCNETGCEQYLSCETCLASPSCGWCDNALYCMKGDRTNTGGCDAVFFYHAYIPGKDYCPSELQNDAKRLRLHERNFSEQWTASPVDSYINSNPTMSNSRITHDIQTEIIELQQKRAKLEREIEELQFNIEKITSETGSAVKITIPDSYIPIRTKNLANYTDYIKQTEDQNLNGKFDDLKTLVNKQIKEDNYRSDTKDIQNVSSEYMQPVFGPSPIVYSQGYSSVLQSQPVQTIPNSSELDKPKQSSRSDSLSNNLKLDTLDISKHKEIKNPRVA